MNTVPASEHNTALSFDAINWVVADRYRVIRNRAIGCTSRSTWSNTIDPITGRDIMDRTSHPHIDDGILTIYFESEETRKAYLDTPIDHPFGKLPRPTRHG